MSSLFSKNRALFRSKMNWILVFTFIFINFGFSLKAQDIEVKTSLDTNAILIGEQTNFNLNIIFPKNYEIDFQKFTDTITDKIEIIDLKIDTLNLGEKIQINYQYLVTSFDSGYHVIPPYIIRYDIKNDSVFKSAESNALLLTVKSVSIDPKGKIKDIKDIMAEPYTFGEIFTRYILPILIILIIAALLFYIYIRRKNNKPIFVRPQKPLPPADVEANEALRKLKEEKLWQNNEIKEYYSRLTDIIRRYIERRFDFPAQEMVTSEIIGSLKSNNISESDLKETEQKLTDADLVKFAKFLPLPNENEQIINWAFEFVEKTSIKPNEEEVKS